MLKTEQTHEEQTIIQTEGFYSCEGIANADPVEDDQSADELKSILEDLRMTQRMGVTLSDASRQMIELIYDNLTEEEIAEHELRIHNDSVDSVDSVDRDADAPAGYDLSPASAPWTAAEPYPIADVLETVGMTVYDVVEYSDAEAEQQCICAGWDEFAPPCAGCMATSGNYPETVIEPAPLGLSLPDRIAAMHDFDLTTIEGTDEVNLLMVEFGLR